MLWYQFLTPLKSRTEIFKEMEPISIINSIKDWLDSGDNEAITGLGEQNPPIMEVLIRRIAPETVHCHTWAS